jgi:hypothetical protein
MLFAFWPFLFHLLNRFWIHPSQNFVSLRRLHVGFCDIVFSFQMFRSPEGSELTLGAIRAKSMDKHCKRLVEWIGGQISRNRRTIMMQINNRSRFDGVINKSWIPANRSDRGHQIGFGICDWFLEVTNWAISVQAPASADQRHRSKNVQYLIADKSAWPRCLKLKPNTRTIFLFESMQSNWICNR